MAGDDEQKATSALSAMINGRSGDLLAPTVASPHFPSISPQPGESEEAIRRRKLQLQQAPSSYGVSSGSATILAPESSPGGGFLQPGEGTSLFDPTKLGRRSPANALSRIDSDDDVLGTQSLHAGGVTNGSSVLTAQAQQEEVRPRKKLMRAGDLEARGSRENSLGADEGLSNAASPIASGSSTPQISAGLQHVQLGRNSSSLHGPSSLSSIAVTEPAGSQMAVDGKADDDTSPVVGRRRKGRKILQESDGSGSDFEPDDAEDDDEDEYKPDEEKPASTAPKTAGSSQPFFTSSQPQPQSRGISVSSQSTYSQPPAYAAQPNMGSYSQPSATSPYLSQAYPSPAMYSQAQSQPTVSAPAAQAGQYAPQSQPQPQHQSPEAYQRFSNCFSGWPSEWIAQAWKHCQGDVPKATAYLTQARQVAEQQRQNRAAPPQASAQYQHGAAAAGSYPGQYPQAQMGVQTGHISPTATYGGSTSMYSQGQARSPGSYSPQQSYAGGQMGAGSQNKAATAAMTMPALSASQVQWLFVNIKPKLPPEMQARVSQMAAQQQLTTLYTFYQNSQRNTTVAAQPQQQSYQQRPTHGVSPHQMQNHQQYMPQQARQSQTHMQSNVMRPTSYPFGSQHSVYKSSASTLQQQQQQQQAYFQKKKRKALDSDESDAGYSDDEGHTDRYLERDRNAKEVQALQYFNTQTAKELQDLTSCTNAQVKLVMDMRPFATVEDVRIKLKKTKGISANLFDNFVDIMQAYTAVDKVFSSCASVGRELDGIMKIWKTAAGKKETPIGTRTGTPLPDGVDESAGTHITEIDAKLVTDTLDNKAVSNEVREAFKGYIKKQPDGIPESINLKGYQMLGVNWLLLLYRKGLSCILADEMGLGKTCQIIAMLAHLKSIGEKGPHLIIVPSSTLENWLREFVIFAPDLRVASYYGTQRERDELRDDIRESIKEGETDVVVTTYNLAAGTGDDKKFLRKCKFRTCVYDEGHQLKNSESKKHKDLMAIDVPWRCLLTGTPLQNNLTELISLLAFILPDIIGSAQDELRAIFKVGPGNQSSMLSKHRIDSAKNIMTPFVLRRKKLQVLQELPPKTGRIEYCEMTELQDETYQDAVQRSKKMLLTTEKSAADADDDIAEAVAEEEAEENAAATAKHDAAQGKRAFTKKGVLRVQQNSSANILMDLRKAANHPMLFRRHYTDAIIRAMSKDCLKEYEFHDRNANLIYEDMDVMTDFELHRFVQPYQKLREKYALRNDEWMDSGKVRALQRLLPEYLEKGDRCLLFSQFTQVLDILEQVLNTMGIRWLKLTGQTSVVDRQSIVDEFYADESIGVFLLSTRAGGLGLNLAAANVVIMHDQDFNPHNDRQAEDRAWRIGQTKDVEVIRLLCRNTIEEDIYALAQTKLELDKEVTMDVASGEVALEDTPSEPTNVTAASLAGPAAKGKKAGRKTKAEKDAAPLGGEGDETAVAKRMSKGLLSRLRDQFEKEEKPDIKPDIKPDVAEVDVKPEAKAEEAMDQT